MSQITQYFSNNGPGGYIQTLTGNTGGAVPPAAGNINIVGSGDITVTGNPGDNTLTISASAIADSFVTDSGTATPAAGVLTVAGGLNINTSGSGSTVTINLDALTNGQLFIGNTGNPATAATLTAGAGINIGNAAGAITISAIGSGFTWTTVTSPTQALATENGYVANDSVLITFTLPSVAAVGSTIKILGLGSGLYTIAQNANQYINFVSGTTTVGTGGSLTATEKFDSITLVCSVVNNGWNVDSCTGNFTNV